MKIYQDIAKLKGELLETAYIAVNVSEVTIIHQVFQGSAVTHIIFCQTYKFAAEQKDT